MENFILGTHFALHKGKAYTEQEWRRFQDTQILGSFKDPSVALETNQLGQTFKYVDPPVANFEDTTKFDFRLEEGLMPPETTPNSIKPFTEEDWYEQFLPISNYPEWDNVQADKNINKVPLAFRVFGD